MRDVSIHPWITPVPLTIGPKDNLKRARAQMRAANVMELVVVDNGKLVGTVSERGIWNHCPTSTLGMDDKQADELLEQFRVGGVMALHPPSGWTFCRAWLYALAVTTRHTSPTALKNLFTAVCNDTFCPLSIITTTICQLNTRWRVKPVALTRNRFSTSPDSNSCLSRSIMYAFFSQHFPYLPEACA